MLPKKDESLYKLIGYCCLGLFILMLVLGSSVPVAACVFLIPIELIMLWAIVKLVNNYLYRNPKRKKNQKDSKDLKGSKKSEERK